MSTIENATPFVPTGLKVSGAQIPSEGPKAVPYQLNFTAQPAYSIDIQFAFQQGQITALQGIYVDNSLGGLFTLTIQGTQQIIKIPAGFQAYISILSPAQGQMIMQGSGGNVPFYLLNYPVTNFMWEPVGGAAFAFDVLGNLKTADQGLAPLITGGGLLVRSTGGGGALNSTYMCDVGWNDGNQHDLFTWNNTLFNFTMTGLRVVLHGGTTAGALRRPRVYFDSGSTPVQTVWESQVWVPVTDKDEDIVLIQEYSLNIPINPTANFGEVQDQTFSGVTGSGFGIQIWGDLFSI